MCVWWGVHLSVTACETVSVWPVGGHTVDTLLVCGQTLLSAPHPIASCIVHRIDASHGPWGKMAAPQAPAPWRRGCRV